MHQKLAMCVSDSPTVSYYEDEISVGKIVKQMFNILHLDKDPL